MKHIFINFKNLKLKKSVELLFTGCNNIQFFYMYLKFPQELIPTLLSPNNDSSRQLEILTRQLEMINNYQKEVQDPVKMSSVELIEASQHAAEILEKLTF